MSNTEVPQVNLITPSDFDLPQFHSQLEKLLDSLEIACVRLSMPTKDEDQIRKAADVLRECCHARDVALIIDQHFRLVTPLGLDGCHLNENTNTIRSVRKELGSDAIIGSFCDGSRHTGLAAGEAGADYVSFGPLAASALGDGSIAEIDLFKWWSEMIEVPVVAEGALTAENVKAVAPYADFLAFGPEIWSNDDPIKELKTLLAEIA